MKKAQEIDVNGTPVRVMRVGDDDFICLTDMAAGRCDETRRRMSLRTGFALVIRLSF